MKKILSFVLPALLLAAALAAFPVRADEALPDDSPEALFQTGSTLPTVGSTATYESETYLVTSGKTTRSNTEFTTLSFTLEKKDASTDAAYS